MVKVLINKVHSSGDLLLLRALDEKKASLATAIYSGFDQFSFSGAMQAGVATRLCGQIKHYIGMHLDTGSSEV
jgi:hypothetical protein